MLKKQNGHKLQKVNVVNMISNALYRVFSLFKSGFFHILTGNFLNKAISMISSIVVVKLVDKVLFADISYVDNIFSYLYLASGLGMSNALLKFCSADQSVEKDMAYVNYSIKIGGTFELFVSILICVLLTVLDIPYPNARIFAWLLVLYPLMKYFVTTGSIYMRTQLDNKKYAYVGIANSGFLCIFTIIFLLIFGTYGIVGARYVAQILILLYVAIYYFKIVKGKKPLALSTAEKKSFFSVGISMGIAGFFSGIMPINESFLVNNIIGDPITTSNFHVAGLLPQLLFLISGAVTVYYFPIVARMTDYRQIKKKVIQIAVVNGVVILLAMSVGMLFTPFAINLLYGKNYLDAVPISYLLWIMRASNCIVRMVPINMLPAIGKVKFNSVMAIVSCAFQCIIDYYFIVTVGISGVAIGATIVYIASGIAYWVYFLKIVNKSIHAGGSL